MGITLPICDWLTDWLAAVCSITNYGQLHSLGMLRRRVLNLSFFCVFYLVAGSHATGTLYQLSIMSDIGEMLCVFCLYGVFVAVLTPSFLSVCPGALQSVKFTCTADVGAILWIQGSHQQYYSSSSTVNDTGSLGGFIVRLVSVDGSTYTSTATVTNTSELLSITGNITLTCDDNGDAIGGDTAVLVVNGNYKSCSLLYL